VKHGAKLESGNYVRDPLSHPPSPSLQSHNTPLHLACRYRQTQVVDLLLSAGARINARNEVSRPVEVLLITHRSKEGNTPLHLSLQTGIVELVSLLMNHGSDLTLENEVRRSSKSFNHSPSPRMDSLHSISLFNMAAPL
jgi:ankyrin repeat protein